ncbi:Type II secretory pathway, component PulK [Anaerohalosphaera lusitana]|uniref:Type II secretory pathway, component PulK n=1 Tax=Anaerohalosphaera lusitana TaxID=1936003 RepID=A0A1U9NPD6_9BACT|nr:hypothetical protein [Anaerohalosphaera lusitana]AQT69769.1 Type II secretory pathway, component PulK [Anaerohalosphaera lusitana]
MKKYRCSGGVMSVWEAFDMDNKTKGSVLIIVVFTVALMSTLVIGILQANTEELQLMQNHVNNVQAYYFAEAGLNHAFSELRADDEWREGFSDEAFGEGSYSVTVTGSGSELVVESTGETKQGFTTKLRANIAIGSVSPHIIRKDSVERVY